MELEYDARYLSVKHHKWRGNLARIIGLSPSAIMTMETGHQGITNKWEWTEEVNDICPSSNSADGDEFELHLKKGKGEQVMNFSTDSLQALLCTARRYMMVARGEDEGKMYAGYKIGRTGDRKTIELSANAGDIVEYIDGGIVN